MVMKNPFTIIIDTREQLPFGFAGLHADARNKRQLLEVPCETRTLASGDYSVAGYEDQIAVERKSLEDLYHSLGRERRRFRREIERLAAMRYAAVMIEATWQTAMESPPELSRLSPKSIFRTILAWQLAWPSVHWWFCANRRMTEIATFRLLERFWKCREAVSPAQSERDQAARIGLAKRLDEALVERDRLQGIVESLAARVAAQSELLSKTSERSQPL